MRRREGWRRAAEGSALTGLTLLAVAGVDRYLVALPTPTAIYLLAIAIAAFHGGIGAGLLSAMMTLAFAAALFMVSGRPPGMALADLGVLAAAAPAMALLVGWQRRRGERAIAQMIEGSRPFGGSEQRIRHIFASMPGFVYERRMAPDGKITFTFASAGIVKLFGITPEEVTHDARAIGDKIDRADMRRIIESTRRSAETLQPWLLDYRVMQPDGTWRWVRGTATPRPLPDGSILWAGFAFDITDQKNIETELERAKAEAESANRTLAEMALTDQLTGLANRRRLQEAFEIELRSARRTGLKLAVLLIDVDRFKAFNDTYGHIAGDECLCKVAEGLRSFARRPRDVAARFGGEEFLLALPETDEPGAARVAEEVRAAIETLAIPHEASELGRVTVSIGVLVVAGADAGDPLEVLKRVDRALYRAKAEGRNRVAVAAPD